MKLKQTIKGTDHFQENLLIGRPVVGDDTVDHMYQEGAARLE